MFLVHFFICFFLFSLQPLCFLSTCLWLIPIFVSNLAQCSDSPSGNAPQKQKYASRPKKDTPADGGVGLSATEKRFAYSLLEKLLEYFDNASVHMEQTQPSTRYSRKGSFAMATEDVKFFGKVLERNCSLFEPGSLHN